MNAATETVKGTKGTCQICGRLDTVKTIGGVDVCSMEVSESEWEAGVIQQTPNPEYTALIETGKTLQNSMLQLTREEGMFVTPAWKMLHHAQSHISKLAEQSLRAEWVSL